MKLQYKRSNVFTISKIILYGFSLQHILPVLHMSGSSSVLSPQSSSPSHVHASGTHFPLPQVCCRSVHSTWGIGRRVVVVVEAVVVDTNGLSVETVIKKC